MQWSTFLPDQNATIMLGERLGSGLKSGGVIYLEGTLGAGKTTLSKGILSACGHSGAVKSPTYTLVEPYTLKELTVYHFDLYRLGDPEELEFIGVRDYFSDASLSLIEWPEKGRGYIPSPDFIIYLSPLGEGREAKIVSETKRGDKVLSSLS